MNRKTFFSYILFFMALSVLDWKAFGQHNSPPETAVQLISISPEWKNQSASEKIDFLSKTLKINPIFFEIHPENAGIKSALSKSFQIYLSGTPINQFLISVHEGLGGKTWIFTPDYNFQQVPNVFSHSNTRFHHPVWIKNTDGFEWFEQVENHQALPRFISQTEFYDQNGALRFVEDGLMRFCPAPDSLVRGAVFRPDPSTKLQIPYGGLLRDRGDSNSVLLTQALDTVLFKVQFQDDTFRLKNNYLDLGEFSLPITPHANLTQPDFCFTRDQPFFEEVNVFYHLTQFRKYIDSLGFSHLANYPLRIDAHGMDGQDQSAYSPSLDILAYGDGNVDDAEDASVIVHEYGHVLSHSAFPFGNSGLERKSTEEGICDYLAGSYSRKISDWEWQRLYKWDGWNEFWPGRNLLSNKHYPESLEGQIHKDGEIFSSALMHLELEIGREITHKILLKSLEMLAPSLSMKQAAFLILESDSLLFNGLHSNQIVSAFDARGISPYSIIVSNDGIVSSDLSRYKKPILYFQNGEMKISENESLPTEIQLFDCMGRIVRSFSDSEIQSRRIRLDGLAPGYFQLRGKSAVGWFSQPFVIH